MKISNVTIMQESNIPEYTFYRLVNKYPRMIDLLKKGVVAEQVLNKEAFDLFLKKTKELDNGFKQS